MDGLADGARVAIIGGGIAGAATACALTQMAPSRGKRVGVRVYAGDGSGPGAPALLRPSCRSALAGLGLSIPATWRPVEIQAIQVISQGRFQVLTLPPGALWVIDEWPLGASGRRQVAHALAYTASVLGAEIIPRDVDRVDHQPPTRTRHGLRPGALVVRAQGSSEAYDASIFAAGSASSLSWDRFFEGFRACPSLPAAHARLRYPRSQRAVPGLATFILAPSPGVDAVWLLPCAYSIYALAFGPEAGPADLCECLMGAARDGHLATGFQISHLSLTAVPCGSGGQLVSRGQLAAGAAAFGHPLQVGLTEALVNARQVATALIEAGCEARPLRRAYLQPEFAALTAQAQALRRATAWLRRAKGRGAKAFFDAILPASQHLQRGSELAVPGITSRSLLTSARRQAVLEVTASLLSTGPVAEAPAAAVEPNLYYVVDDDPETRSTLLEFLQARGAKAVAFEDELALFSAVARHPPTAVLLDVVLNWVDGLRLCRGLKRHPLTRASPVFIISGLTTPGARDRALAAGAQAFIPKPVDPPSLWHLLRGKDLPHGSPELSSA
jgi:CheY-like chemotaxis protein